MVPILMITHNRLEYTKQAFESMMRMNDVFPFIIDNASTDGTQEWLKKTDNKVTILTSETNMGISGAMNLFFKLTEGFPILGKIDNDTLAPVDFIDKMVPYLQHADIIQAKHHIIKETHPDGWAGFTRNMRKENGLLYNNYVGGSGILFLRDNVKKIPDTKWKLGGWRQFQAEHPQLKKAFVPEVEILLLDSHGYGDYPEYYKQTGRI